MMSRVFYRKVRTMAELKERRRRIDRELDVRSRRLGDDWRDLSRMFTVGYAVQQITSRAGQFYSFVRMGMTGYRYVRSVVEKYKDEQRNERHER